MKKKNYFIMLTAALILTAGAVFQSALYAEDPAPVQESETLVLTVDDAVERALENNLGLAAEKINLLLKESAKKNSYNVLIPKVNTGITFLHMNQEQDPVTTLIPSGSTGIPNTYDYVTQVSVDIPNTFYFAASLSAAFVLSPPVFHAMKQTCIEYDMGKISYQAAQQKLVRDVRKSFYTMLLSEQSLGLMEKNIAMAKSRYDAAAANFAAGIVDEYTKLDAQVKYENMKPALEDMKNAYRISLLAFRILINVPLDADIKLSGSITDPESLDLDADILVSDHLLHRLDLQNISAAILLGQNACDILWLSMLPALSISWSFDPMFMRDPFAYNWFEDMETWWSQPYGKFSIGVSVSLDALLPFSKTQTDLANARLNVKKTKLALDQASQAAEYEVRAILMRLKKSKETITTLRLNVALAEKANMIGQEAYKAGIKDYSQIESTELGLQQAQYEMLKEKFNYITGLLDLAYALNMTEQEIISLGKTEK